MVSAVCTDLLIYSGHECLSVVKTTSRFRRRRWQERQRGRAQPGGRLRDAHLLVLAHAHQLAHRRAQHPTVARVPKQLLDGVHVE